jgi:hypothetical protein
MPERRVLFVCNVDWFVLLHWSDLLSDMVRRGHRVHVLCGDSGRLEEIRRLGVTVDAIPISRAGTKPFDELRALARIARGIREFRPDLVHTVTIKPTSTRRWPPEPSPGAFRWCALSPDSGSSSTPKPIADCRGR